VHRHSFPFDRLHHRFERFLPETHTSPRTPPPSEKNLVTLWKQPQKYLFEHGKPGLFLDRERIFPWGMFSIYFWGISDGFGREGLGISMNMYGKGGERQGIRTWTETHMFQGSVVACFAPKNISQQ
jgi:hypothetical protein